MIDIDLIKGSSFPKNKTKLGLFSIIFNSIIRLAFLPIYLKWWQYQTNRFFSFMLLIVYFLQIANLYIYNTENLNLIYKNKQVCSKFYWILCSFVYLFKIILSQIITLGEIMTPSLLMLILGIIYTYITSSIPCSNNDIEK